MTTLQVSTPTSLHAFAVQSLRKTRLLATVVDTLLVFVGTVSSIAVCIDFMNWLGTPLDSAALTAMALLVGCIWSICWSIRYVCERRSFARAPAAGKHESSTSNDMLNGQSHANLRK